MSYDNERLKFEKERIHVVEIDVPRCLNTYNSSPCTAEQYILNLTVTSGEFQVGDTIDEVSSGRDFIIERITRTGFVLRVSVSLVTPAQPPSTISDTYNNTTRPGSATKQAGALQLDRCYNTRSTCQDLPNYNEEITTSATGTVDIKTTLASGLSRSLGSFITDGFAVGDLVSVTGFTNSANNTSYKVISLSATLMGFSDVFNATPESVGGSAVVVTKKNLFTYKFCSPRAPHPQNMNNYFPCVENVSIAPAKIDPKGGIGARTSASISVSDFPSSDRNDIDPYLSTRPYLPFDVGLFWLKWRARNANYENYAVRVLSGYLVDNTFDPANFQTRYYVFSTLNVSNGSGEITLKDPLQLVSNKKALAPRPSDGVLASVMNTTQTNFTLKPAGIGNAEYPASNFYVKIGAEIIFVTTRTGDNCNPVTRARFNTVAAAHAVDDTVQLCLYYTGQTVDAVQRDLCVTYAGIPGYFIPFASWNGEASAYLQSNPIALIPDPTEVDKLIGELCDQWPHHLYWDDRQNQIIFKAMKAPPQGTEPLTGDDNLIEMTVRDRPEMQLSTVFVFYGQFNPTLKLDDKENYVVTYARVNTDAIARYDSNNTKTVFSRWISSTNGQGARQLATLHGRRFGIIPREVNFMLEDKDSDLWIGDIRKINHYDIVDQNGYQQDTVFEVLSANEAEVYNYDALEYTFDVFQANDVTPGVDVVFIQGDQFNINLRTLYDALYTTATASTVAKFLVVSGANVGSTSTGTPSMVTGSWPAGAQITLEVQPGGLVAGRGGDGSQGAGTATAGAGGTAISMAYAMELVNNGIIGGGGGGGGSVRADNLGAAGSGGAGFNVGVAGTNDSVGTYTPIANNQPGNGSTTAGGSASFISYNGAFGFATLTGGQGGGLGQAGTIGNGTGNVPSTSAAGAAGVAIARNGFTLTQTNTGDVRGAIT